MEEDITYMIGLMSPVIVPIIKAIRRTTMMMTTTMMKAIMRPMVVIIKLMRILKTINV